MDEDHDVLADALNCMAEAVQRAEAADRALKAGPDRLQMLLEQNNKLRKRLEALIDGYGSNDPERGCDGKNGKGTGNCGLPHCGCSGDDKG